VATFSDPAGAELPGDYTATINWGDGSDPENVAITTYGQVSGTHTYAEESAADHPGSNPYHITVVVHHEGTDSNTATTDVHVNDVQLTNATGVSFNAYAGETFTGTVATFTDPAGSESVADYSASINWGAAGTGSTTGTIVSDGGGNFHVVGSY